MSKEGSRCAPLFLLLRLEVPCWLLDIPSLGVGRLSHAYGRAVNEAVFDLPFSTLNVQQGISNVQGGQPARSAVFTSSVGSSLLSIGYSLFCPGLQTGSCT